MLLSQRYQLEEKLGAGGMGEVYLATDLDTQKKVAVKIASVTKTSSVSSAKSSSSR